MHTYQKMALLCCITAAVIVNGETITAKSNVFSFPSITRVATNPSANHYSWFRQSGFQRGNRSVTFSWMLPGTNDRAGSITIYSLLGKVVATIPVTQSSGTATWNLPRSQSRSGIYIARLSSGDHIKNLKLMLWN
jgi:hypothetical protein